MTDRRSRNLTHASVENLAVARSKSSRHLTESPSSENLVPEALSAVAEETENCWLETRTKCPKRPNLLKIEDFENQASPQSAFDAFGLGGRESNGASSFVSSSDEERKSAGRARVLQRRGRARVRELVKMAESMPEEAKRPGALETKSVTRKTLELHATSVLEFCDWSGLSADSNVKALEVDRLLTEFMNLLFSEGHRAWKGENLLASVFFFFPTFSKLEGNRLARSF